MSVRALNYTASVKLDNELETKNNKNFFHPKSERSGSAECGECIRSGPAKMSLIKSLLECRCCKAAVSSWFRKLVPLRAIPRLNHQHISLSFLFISIFELAMLWREVSERFHRGCGENDHNRSSQLALEMKSLVARVVRLGSHFFDFVSPLRNRFGVTNGNTVAMWKRWTRTRLQQFAFWVPRFMKCFPTNRDISDRHWFAPVPNHSVDVGRSCRFLITAFWIRLYARELLSSRLQVYYRQSQAHFDLRPALQLVQFLNSDWFLSIRWRLFYVVAAVFRNFILRLSLRYQIQLIASPSLDSKAMLNETPEGHYREEENSSEIPSRDSNAPS